MTLQIEESDLEVLYPALVRTDANGRIVSFGPAITRHVPGAQAGVQLSELFSIADFHDRRSDGGVSDVRQPLRVSSRNGGAEFIGSCLRYESGVVYLLLPAPRTADIAISRFSLSDFPPCDSRIALMVTLSLQRALLAETQEAVQEIARARDVAESALRSQTEFLTGVSHELHTPLAGICGFSELLAEDPVEATARTGERIHEAALELAHKLDNLIDYAALRGGRIDVEREAVHLEQISASLVGLGLMARNKGLTFTVSIAADAPATVNASRRHLLRIIGNLGHNAIAFTAAGVVGVEISREGTDRLRVTVSDSGPGLLAEISARVFNGSRQIGDLGDREPYGLGLGLILCREIIAKMSGGLVSSRSSPAGSTISVDVPIGYPGA